MSDLLQLMLENGLSCYINSKHITVIEPITSDPLKQAKSCITLCCGTKLKVRQTVKAIIEIINDPNQG